MTDEEFNGSIAFTLDDCKNIPDGVLSQQFYLNKILTQNIREHGTKMYGAYEPSKNVVFKALLEDRNSGYKGYLVCTHPIIPPEPDCDHILCVAHTSILKSGSNLTKKEYFSHCPKCGKKLEEK